MNDSEVPIPPSPGNKKEEKTEIQESLFLLEFA